MPRPATRLALCLALPCALILGNAQAEDIYTYTNSQGDVVFTDQPTKGAKKITVTAPPPIPLTPIDLPPTAPRPPLTAAPAAPNPPIANGGLVPSMPMTPPTVIPPASPNATAVPGTPKLPAGDQLQPSTPNVAPAYTPLSQETTPAMAKRSDHYQSLIITEPKAGSVTARDGGTIFVQTQLTPALDVTAGDRIRILIDGTTRVDDSTGNRFMISDLNPGTHAIIAAVMRHGKNIFQSNPVVIQLQSAPAAATHTTNAPN